MREEQRKRYKACYERCRQPNTPYSDLVCIMKCLAGEEG